MIRPDSHRYPLLPYAVILLALAVVAVFLFSLPNVLSMDDALRHFVMASAMAERGILSVPGWSAFMYQGTLSTLRADPWFLSEVLLVPLVPLGMAGAIKVFTVGALAAVLFAFDLLLRFFGLSPRMRALFLTLLLTFNGLFLFRSLVGRPFPLLTAMCLLILWALLNRRYAIAAVVCTLSVLLSQLFAFPLGIACIVAAWQGAARGPKAGIAAILPCALGTVAGIALHPNPVDFIRYMLFVFLPSPFVAGSEGGIEMHSGFGSDMTTVALAVGAAAMMLFLVLHKNRPRWREWIRSDLALLIALTVLFLGAFAVWQRAIDILWPLLVLLVARIVSLHPDLPAQAAAAILPPRASKFILPVLACVCILTPASRFSTLARGNPGNDLSAYAGMRTVPDGARVLNADWDLFPALLAVQPDARYATGIDAATTILQNPEAARLLAQVGARRNRDEIAAVDARAWLSGMLAEYPAEYLVFGRRLKRTEFLGQLETDPRVTSVSASGAIAVYIIK